MKLQYILVPKLLKMNEYGSFNSITLTFFLKCRTYFSVDIEQKMCQTV